MKPNSSDWQLHVKALYNWRYILYYSFPIKCKNHISNLPVTKKKNGNPRNKRKTPLCPKCHRYIGSKSHDCPTNIKILNSSSSLETDLILRETVIDTELEDVIDTRDFAICQNCLRQSTTFYPLTLTKVQVKDISKKKFGSNDIWKDEVVFCENHCVIYLREEHDTSWIYTWPAFFCILFVTKRRRVQFLVE